jgi:hypothetical protein
MAEKIEVDIPPFVRLAIRREGKMVNAYFAPPESMEAAKLVASINPHFINTDDKFKRWREFLQEGLRDAVKGALGLEITDFVIDAGPEHERSGHG